MRPIFPRGIVRSVCVLSFTAALALGGLASAQTSSASKHKVAQRTLLDHSVLDQRLSTADLVLAPSTAKNGLKVRPQDSSDSWTGGGDGTSWNNASNWSAGVPNGSTVDVTI